MFKKLVSLCVLFALLISVTGCGVLGVSDNTTESVTSTQTEKERVIEEAEAYLKESYPDDDFTYVSGKSPDWAYRYYELAFTTKKYDNQTVIVYGDPKKDDNPNSIVTSYYTDDNGDVIYDYFDTYYQYSMKEEANRYFDNIVVNYLGEETKSDVAFYTTFGASQQIDSKSSFKNNIENNDMDILLWFESDENLEIMRDDIEIFLEKLIEKKIYTLVCFQYKKNSSDKEYTGFLEYTTYDGIIEEAN